MGLWWVREGGEDGEGEGRKGWGLGSGRLVERYFCGLGEGELLCVA